MGDILNLKDLEAVGALDFLEINEVWIWEKVNEHGRMSVSGILKEEIAQEIRRTSLFANKRG